jgi:hypothetical protein
MSEQKNNPKSSRDAKNNLEKNNRFASGSIYLALK